MCKSGLNLILPDQYEIRQKVSLSHILRESQNFLQNVKNNIYKISINLKLQD